MIRGYFVRHAQPEYDWEVDKTRPLTSEGKERADKPKTALELKFYDNIEDEKLEFAVIIAKTQGKWVFCKHKERNTYEFPGGHREEGENILHTARRELQEETGAIHYEIKQIGVYSVAETNESNELVKETFGMLYFANIESFEKELHYEIEKLLITETLPDKWTYPLIQPKLFAKAKECGYL